MNNNHDKSGPASNAEEKIQQPRIIQIPVQHIKTPLGGTPREESPLRTNKLPKHFQDQYTNPSSGFPSSRPSMFDRFDSPFESPLNRHFVNREIDPRFPLLSRYDDDDFFRPSHHDSMLNTDSFFHNTPPREFTSNSNTNHPPGKEQQDSSLASKPVETNVNNLNASKFNSNNINTNQLGGNVYQSTIPVRRTDSPQRFVSQTTIYPNQFQGSQGPSPTSNTTNTNANSSSTGIPIKIQHISTLPHKSDFTDINPDSVSQKKVPPANQPIPSNASSSDQTTKSNKNSNINEKPNNESVNESTPPKPSFFKNESPPKMTDTSSSTTKKTNAQSDFASPLNTQPSENVSQKPNENSPPPPSKTPQDKCEEVLHELNNLEKEVEQFSGRKNEKSFLKIDEYLTRCLLKLDEIERTDDKLNQIRKRLINYTQLLSDKLEAKALMNENNEKKAESNNQANKQKSESSTNETMELKKDDNNNDTKVTEQ